jgi:hypothetical protein
VHHHVFRLYENLRARRDENREVLSILAVPIVPFSMAPALCLKNALVLKMKERIHPRGAFQINIPSPTAIAAAGPAFGHKLLPAEGKAAVASVSCNYLYFCPIDKQLRNPAVPELVSGFNWLRQSRRLDC